MTTTRSKNKDFCMYYIVADHGQGTCEVWYTDDERQAQTRYKGLSAMPVRYLSAYKCSENNIALVTASLLPDEDYKTQEV